MRRNRRKKNGLVQEAVDGDVYEYYPLGEHIVAAPKVCDGVPTFKYTRVEVAGIVRQLGAGWTVEEIVTDFNRPELSAEAIEEAAQLAADALASQSAGLFAKAA